VQDGNVFVAGTVTINRNDQAAFWKNGKLTILGPGHAYELFLSGDDTYIAGEGIDTNNGLLAVTGKTVSR